LSSFSGSVGVQYASQVLSDNQHILIENALEVSLWQLVLGPSAGIRFVFVVCLFVGWVGLFCFLLFVFYVFV
jgi:hypothetical protein